MTSSELHDLVKDTPEVWNEHLFILSGDWWTGECRDLVRAMPARPATAELILEALYARAVESLGLAVVPPCRVSSNPTTATYHIVLPSVHSPRLVMRRAGERPLPDTRLAALVAAYKHAKGTP